MKKALVFGGTGQMGSYLVELLVAKGYQVDLHRLDFSWSSFAGREFDMILAKSAPDEIYNMAAKMHAEDSWKEPAEYLKVNGTRVLDLLEAVIKYKPDTKVFQAGSAEVFDKGSVFQSEDTNRLPMNPYGLSKILAMEAVRIYRQRYGLFCCTGIFFNAESPRRKGEFFAKKAAREAVRIKMELEENGLFLPAHFEKLQARRDWGWAPEYAEVAWKMLQLEQPVDMCIGTGQSNSCREFILACLKAADIPKCEEDFDKYVRYEKVREYQPGNQMRAVPFVAKQLLGWEAQYKMQDVARMLVEAEKEAYKNGKSSLHVSGR